MIPKTIHRILIRNSQIPTEAYEFFVNANSINSEYTQIVWKNDDVIHLMNNVEKHIYESYKLNSHKENFAKYIILKYHGGIVCDLFVEFHHNINELLQNYSDKNFLLFSEKDTVINYIIASGNFAPEVQEIIELCRENKNHLPTDTKNIVNLNGSDLLNRYKVNKNLPTIHSGLYNKYFVYHTPQEKDNENKDKISKIYEFYQNHEIDPDFDHLFYEQVYPDVIDYYKSQFPLDDRHRLYYHWYLYGKKLNRAINSNQLYDSFSPLVSKRDIKSENSELAIITTYFNPCGYKSVQNNYLKFYENVKNFGEVFPVELSFNNQFFINHDNTIRISGNKRNILWQKECLLNIALQQLPKKYKNVAWLDCDILFLDNNWINQLYKELDSFHIVQLFNTIYKLDEHGDLITNATNKCYAFPGGASGYAWAARRETLDSIKFLDNQILGMADTIMAQSFSGMPYPKHLKNQNTTQCWYNNAKNIVNKSYSYVNTEIAHMYHGNDSNRLYRYGDRYTKIFGETDYLGIINKNSEKIWEFKQNVEPQMQKSVENFFLNRDEDDCAVDINKFFSKIYVTNWTKQYEKYVNFKQKTNRLKINATRFELREPNHIQYNIKYDYFPYIRDKKTKCILDAHISIIKEAIDKKYENILIFEDSVKFCNNFDIHIQNISNIKHWKLLYLGSNQKVWDNIQYEKNFYLTNNTRSCFAYAIHSSIYKDIINLHNLNSEWPIDMIMTDIQKKYYGKCYCFHPNICITDTQTTEASKQTKWNILEYI